MGLFFWGGGGGGGGRRRDNVLSTPLKTPDLLVDDCSCSTSFPGPIRETLGARLVTVESLQ